MQFLKKCSVRVIYVRRIQKRRSMYLRKHRLIFTSAQTETLLFQRTIFIIIKKMKNEYQKAQQNLKNQ